MVARSKQPPKGPSRPPDPFWLSAAMIGLSISTMAASAIAVGASLALGKAIASGE